MTTATVTKERASKKAPEARFYLKLEGIQGSARAAGYEGWIPIFSCQFGAGVAVGRGRRRPGNASNGKPADEDEESTVAVGDIIVDETEEEAFYRRVRESRTAISSASLSEVTITKLCDATSPLLLHYTTLRRPFRGAIIEHVYDNITTRFTLSSVFLSGLSVSADGEAEDMDDQELQVAPGESLSLNFQQMEMSVVDKVRRPLALPQTPAYAAFNPHLGVDAGFPLPLELIVSIFLRLDQQSLSRAAMACKRFLYAASDDQLKVFAAHTVGYDLTTYDTHLDGRLVAPFWPPEADDEGQRGW